jgi:hypothetical protein
MTGLLIPSRGISLEEEGAAFLTAALVAQSPKVESTTTIVKLWLELQKRSAIKDEIDYIVAILTSGRALDIKEEIKNLDIVFSSMRMINKEIRAYVDSPEKLDKNAALHAFLTSAVVSDTKKIESTKEIANLWRHMQKDVTIAGDRDMIVSILTLGRITELKLPISTPEQVREIMGQIGKEIGIAYGKKPFKIGNKEIVSAYLTSAFISATPKMERIRDIVETWQYLMKETKVQDEDDMISIILATGRVKDLDSMHMVNATSVKDLIKKIKGQIIKIRGERG